LRQIVEIGEQRRLFFKDGHDEMTIEDEPRQQREKD
jgi:hypothetical protein